MGLFFTIRHYRYSRTWSYIERYNSADFIQTRKQVEIFLVQINKLETVKEQQKFIRRLISSESPKDIEMNIHLSRYVNLFTELGVAFRSGAINKKALYSISTMIVYSWENKQLYINEVRKTRKPHKVHSTFEKLYNYISKTGIHYKD